MMEKNKENRLLRVELEDDVKKVSITGKDSDEKVVMRQELSEDDLELVTGGQEIFGGDGTVSPDESRSNISSDLHLATELKPDDSAMFTSDDHHHISPFAK